MPDSPDAVRRLFERFFAVFIFVLVLGLYPYTGDPTGDVKELLTAWGALLIGGGWLFVAWWRKIPYRQPPLFLYPLSALLVLYTVAALASDYRAIGLIETGRFFCLAALYFIATQVYTTPEALHRLLKTLVIASFAATLYGFLQAGGYDPVPWDPGDMETDIYTGLPASYGNPNFAAHVMVLTLPGAIYLLLRERKLHWAVITAALVLHLGLTGQRASYIAFAGAISLAVIVWMASGLFRGKPGRAMAASLFSWCLLGLAGLAAGMALLNWRTGSPLPLDTSLHIRYWSYVSATDMLRDAPLLGHGPGAYAHTYHNYWTQLEQEWFVQELRKNAHVHNDLMEIAIDAGLPAAGLYLLIFLLGLGGAAAVATGARPGGRALGVLYSVLFAGFLLDGLFGFPLRVPVSAGYFFLLLGGLDGLLATPRPAPERRRFHGPALAAAGALVLLALVRSCVFASEMNLFRGSFALRANALDAAARELRNGETLAPWNGNFALQLSKVAFLKGDLPGALAEIDRMFRISPDYFPARITRARYKLLAAQRALQADPKHIEAPLVLLAEARQDAQVLIDVCGKHPDAQRLLGRAAAATAIAMTTADPDQGAKEAQVHWREAEEHLEKAMKLPSEEQDVLFLVQAQVKLAVGKPNEAEAAFERAATANPANPVVWSQFLAFANGNKRYERIRNTLVALIGKLSEEEYPRKDVLALTRMCLANVQENGFGDLTRAEQEYRAAVEASPLSPEAWSNFARFAFQHGKVELLKTSVLEARDKLVAAQKEVPAQLAAVYAAVRLETKALEGASAVLLAQVRGHRADAPLSATEAYEWSARLMLDALQGVPAQEECVTKLNMAIIYLQFKNFGLADQLFASSLGCLPEPLAPRHAAQWSEALLALDRGLEAVNLLRPMTEKHPEVLDVRLAYARALARVGQTPEAKAAYEQLLANPELGGEGRALVEKEAAALN